MLSPFALEENQLHEEHFGYLNPLGTRVTMLCGAAIPRFAGKTNKEEETVMVSMPAPKFLYLSKSGFLGWTFPLPRKSRLRELVCVTTGRGPII